MLFLYKLKNIIFFIQNKMTEAPIIKTQNPKERTFELISDKEINLFLILRIKIQLLF